MPPKAPVPDMTDPIRRYQAGEPAEKLARELGVGGKTFRKWLTAAGVQVRTRGEASTVAFRLEMPDMTNPIRRYLAGETAQALAGEAGVSIRTFQKWLTACGIQPRGMAEAALMRDYRMPAEARRVRASAAHTARRGNRNSLRHGLQRAATVERAGRAATKDEAELAFWLARAGYVPVLQKAIGVYNVDLALEELRVAVELNGITHVVPFYADQRADPAVRLEYILNAGWSVLEIVTHPARYSLRPVAAEQVVAFLDVAGARESPRGEHRMVTGNGEVFTGLGD